MLALLKYLKLLPLFKDAVSAYKEEEGKPVPAILHRRVFGAIILLVGTGIAVYYGIEGDVFTANLGKITESLDSIISAALVLYGAIMMIIGQIKSKRA
jgi:hypothetical protein